MEKLDLENEVGSTLFIIKKNYTSFYLSLIGLVIFSLLSILCSVALIFKFEWVGLGYNIVCIIGCVLFEREYERGKEISLIITKDSFIIRYSNSKKVQEFDFWVYDLKSFSIKSNGEVILLSEEEFPWGKRKVVLSEEYMDRKKEVLKFLEKYT